MKVSFDPYSESNSGWTRFNSEEEFLWQYPAHIYGRYMPQPWYSPERYPCFANEVAIMNNPNGADHVMLAYIYDFEDEGEGWFCSKSRS